MRAPRRLAEHIEFEATEPALEREWSAVAARQRALKPLIGKRRAFAAGAIAFVLVCAVAGYLLLAPGGRLEPVGRAPIIAATTFVSDAGRGEQSVILADGSTMRLGADSRVHTISQTEDEVAVELQRGRVDFDVVPNPGRRFSVTAKFVSVTVRGTRFSVAIDDGGASPLVAISVARGSVEVVRLDGIAERVVLGPGMSWSAIEGVAQKQPAEGEPAETAPPEELGAKTASPAVKSPRAAADSERDSPPSPDDPAILFKQAESRMRSSDAAGAAELFARLLAKFPADGHIGLAAFQLGRLRLDALGDPRGALDAFDRALAAGNSTPFAEDAAARRVEALDALGDGVGCRKAKEAFLAAYPQSLHAPRVAERCGE